MATVRVSKKGPKAVPAPPSRPSYVLGSRPSSLYAPKSAPRADGDITRPPRIVQNSASQRDYSKKPPKATFGDTGAY